jgi:hypothetical protein
MKDKREGQSDTNTKDLDYNKIQTIRTMKNIQ